MCRFQFIEELKASSEQGPLLQIRGMSYRQMKERWKGVFMKKILSICTLFVVVATVLVWYHLPIKSKATAELYCDVPNVSELYAEFDLRISRSLFSPLAIDGTIRIGDVDYVVWGRKEHNFFSNMQRKVKGEMNIPVFVNAANFGQGTSVLISDLLFIHSIQFGDNYIIENVSFSLTSDDYGLWSSFTMASQSEKAAVKDGQTPAQVQSV